MTMHPQVVIHPLIQHVLDYKLEMLNNSKAIPIILQTVHLLLT